MKKALLLLLVIILSPTLLFGQNRPLVFRNVTLIDMRSEQPKPNMTVVIKDDRIAKIGKNIKIPKDAQIVDASGRLVDDFADPVMEGYNMVNHQVNGIQPGLYYIVLSDEHGNYAAEDFFIGK